MEIEIVGCSPATPEGVCDTCSGEGELETEDRRIIQCHTCRGSGGTDPDAVRRTRAFNTAYRAALLDGE